MSLEPRKASPRTMPRSDLDEVFHSLDKQDGKIDSLESKLDMHILAFQGLQRAFESHKDTTTQIKNSIETMVIRLGDETEDGDGGWKGTGLLGRIRRNEGAVARMMRLYRSWILYGSGFASGFVFLATAATTIVWYLLTHNIKLSP